MDVLSSRILVKPSDFERSQRFYRETLGLAVAREFGSGTSRGIVFFLGGGQLEVSGHGPGADGAGMALWVQVRDIGLEHKRLVAAGALILQEPRFQFWGLHEMVIADPDGLNIVIVEVPEDHPQRRDQRVFDPSLHSRES
jgi:catechol 2,3-dioxygenase-like lactoylglutathione lyase family enzyme